MKIEDPFENYVEYACSVYKAASWWYAETLAKALATQYFVHTVAQPRILEVLIRCAETYKPARDALGHIMRSLRRQGRPFPNRLADWLVELKELGGHLVRPKPIGREPYTNFSRNAFILHVVYTLRVEVNLNPTRAGGGPEKCSREGGTGCDVAGVALSRCDNDKEAPKYKTYEDIWGRRNKRLTHIAYALTCGGLSLESYRGYRESTYGEFDPEEDCPDEWYPDERYEEQCIKEAFGNLYDLLGGKSYGKFFDVPIGTIRTKTRLRRCD